MLTWRPAPDRRSITATGGKGIYTIRWEAGQYVLTGVGHDQLSMLALPRQFNSLDRAKDHAAALERVTAKEWQVSGC